jgi:hypothetical protein
VESQTFRKFFLLSVTFTGLLSLPTAYLLMSQPPFTEDPSRAVNDYLKALYARDYRTAYHWISAEDRKNKSESEYLRENPSFSAVALELTGKLAQMIELHNLRSETRGDRATIRFTIKLPDANAGPLQKLLLDFDPDKLGRLSNQEKQAVEEKLESMRKRGTLPMIEGDDSVELMRENGKWKVFTNWGAAIRVRFSAEVKEGLPWKFWPVQESTLVKPGETLQAFYKAKNLSSRPITAKARHLDKPKEFAGKYLEIIQCFCFIQQTLGPGEEKEFPLVFRVNGDVPTDVKEFYVYYEFYPVEKFPEK